MAREGRPWAVVITAAVAALVAAGALAMAATLKDRAAPADEASTNTSAPSSGVGVDGCALEPCVVLDSVPVGGTTVELVADRGAASGRVRIGGAGASEVIEVAITGMGAILGSDSLQCVAGAMTACLVRGQSPQGTVGQVIVGRSGKWNELALPFQSDAGYLALADVTADTGPEVLVAQHACDRQRTADCSTSPVYVRVYNLRSQEKGCTVGYDALDELPEWPVVRLTSASLSPCG